MIHNLMFIIQGLFMFYLVFTALRLLYFNSKCEQGVIEKENDFSTSLFPENISILINVDWLIEPEFDVI